MSNVLPFRVGPAAHAGPAPAPSDAQPAAHESFAAVLGQLEETSPPIALKSALAEVFNAHGFFQSGIAPAHRPPSAPEPLPVRQCKGRDAALGTGDDGRDNSRLWQDRGSFAGWELDGDGRTATKAGAQARISGRDNPNRAGLTASPRAVMPQSASGMTTAASRVVVGSFQDAGEVPRPATPSAASPPAISTDRLLFQIGAQSVQLVGRLHDLGPDERQKLIEELQAELSKYGLSLGDAKLNGVPILHFFSGSNPTCR